MITVNRWLILAVGTRGQGLCRHHAYLVPALLPMWALTAQSTPEFAVWGHYNSFELYPVSIRRLFLRHLLAKADIRARWVNSTCNAHLKKYICCSNSTLHFVSVTHKCMHNVVNRRVPSCAGHDYWWIITDCSQSSFVPE